MLRHYVEGVLIQTVHRQMPRRDEFLDAIGRIALALVSHVSPYPEYTARKESMGIAATGTCSISIHLHEVVRQTDGIALAALSALCVIAATCGKARHEKGCHEQLLDIINLHNCFHF